MKAITIVNRALTLKESNQVNLGFDTLMREEHVALEETEPIHFVAIQEDNLIGCAIGLAHKNGDVFSGWFHFTDLFVEKEFRNLGIGASLLKELEAHCKGRAPCSLDILFTIDQGIIIMAIHGVFCGILRWNL